MHRLLVSASIRFSSAWTCPTLYKSSSVSYTWLNDAEETGYSVYQFGLKVY